MDQILKIPLRRTVQVTEIVDGQTRVLTGQVVGATSEQFPHYDVLVEGRIIANVPHERVREPRARSDIFGVVR